MDKKTINIGFKNFGQFFDPQDFFIIKMLKKKYNVVISNHPNYLFYSVYSDNFSSKNLYKKGDFFKKISPSLYLFLRRIYCLLKNLFKTKKIESPKGDFVKIFFTHENIKPNMDECDWAFSSCYDERIKNSKHMRLPSYFIEALESSLDKEKFNFLNFKRKHKKFCNFVYSQEVPIRNKFFKELSKYKKIDAPGRSMTNMRPISHSNPKESRSSKDWIREKLEFIKDYKFTIAFENASTPGYTTEKIYHALLAGTIPIYYGNPLIHKEFNTKRFINCHDFKNFKEALKKIISLDKNDKLYKEMINQPWYIDNKPNKYVNVERVEKRLDEIFD